MGTCRVNAVVNVRDGMLQYFREPVTARHASVVQQVAAWCHRSIDGSSLPYP